MKIPDENFFDKLKLSIDDLIDDEQLSVGRIGHPFIVPKGYFLSLYQAINLRIDSLSQPAGRNIRFFPQVKLWYGAAAVIMITLASLWFLDKPATTSVDDLSQEDILAYFEIEPVNYYEISDAAEFTDQTVNSLTDTYFQDDFDEDELFVNSTELLLEEIKQLDEK